MKFKSFVYAAMATFLFAACSDSEQLDGTQTAVTTERLADGYVALQINLPTTPGSRAANDQFDDGTANEYKVENGALLLFAGDNEKTATFKTAYDLSLQDYWISAPDKIDNITTSKLVAVKITNPAANNEKLYGLVMINYTGVAKISEKKLTLGGYTGEFTGTFADFVAATSSAPFYKGSGSNASAFFMINAPISSVGDGDIAPTSKNVTTLVEITNSIQPTKADAEAKPASSFFVERAVAKATLSFTATELTDNSMVAPNGKTVELKVGDAEWMLNATNTSSYIVRNMYGRDSATDFLGYKAPGRGYRMVGNAKIGTTIIQPAIDYYRTYWCYDPTYNTAGGLSYKNNNATGFVKAEKENPLYCYENTFDVEHQRHQNTTQALIKVKLQVYVDGEAQDNTTFYTINEKEDIIYVSKEDATAHSISYILQSDEVTNAVNNAFEGVPDANLKIDGSNYSEYLSITFERKDNGRLEATGITFNDDAFVKLGASAPVWAEGDNVGALLDNVNKAYRIAEYKDGVSYYAVRFKHFAGKDVEDLNDLAPWNPNHVGSWSYDYNNYKGVKEAGAENMWLGRYGMVRNNWYDVQVTGVKHLGKPSIEGLEVSSDDIPDDEVEEWIAFNVNILSWAKRTQQNVTL